VTSPLSRLFSIEGKVAVVTGGSRGIGRMIAAGFVEAGARVYISSRNAEACDEVATELSKIGTCIAVPAHLGSLEGAEHLVATVADRELAVHILVNNAGAIWEEPLDDYSDGAFDKLWDINVRAVFRLTKLLLPQLRAAATPTDPARVVNVGSIDAVRPPLFETYAYSASKAGEHMLSQHLALRLAADHITVNVIAPGPFESRMTRSTLGTEDGRREMLSHVPLARVGTPDEAAGLAIFLASPAAAYITGTIIPLDGGMAIKPG
jgi:NAD(P)-dependent dehydrogenase (short-subunit alcohol dehydrogenase family)